MNTTSDQDRDLEKLLLKEMDLTIDGGIVLDWVAETFLPEQVFDEDELVKWAENNGYVLEE